MEITPEMQEIIDAKINEARSSFEEERDRLAANGKKLLNEKKNLEERFKDIDVDDYHAMKQALKDKDEEELLKSGKIDELVDKRAQVIRSELEAKIAEKDQELESTRSSYGKLQHSFDSHRINETLRSMARSDNVLEEAMDDVIRRASGMFSIDKDGNIVSFDDEGQLRLKDGKAITPKSFLADLKKNAPHLWPRSEGAALRGSSGQYEPGSSLSDAASGGDMASYRKLRKQQKANA